MKMLISLANTPASCGTPLLRQDMMPMSCDLLPTERPGAHPLPRATCGNCWATAGI